MRRLQLKQHGLIALTALSICSTSFASVYIVNNCDNQLAINEGHILIDGNQIQLNQTITSAPLKLSDNTPMTVTVQDLAQGNDVSLHGFRLEGTKSITSTTPMQNSTITVSNCQYTTDQQTYIRTADIDITSNE